MPLCCLSVFQLFLNANDLLLYRSNVKYRNEDHNKEQIAFGFIILLKSLLLDILAVSNSQLRKSLHAQLFPFGLALLLYL